MSNAITRTYSFSNGGTADGGQVDSEIQNIVNTINNADAATTAWTNVKTGILTVTGASALVSLTTTGTTILKGTTTNDSAAAGNIGEYMSASAALASAPTSGQYGDIANIVLTAGDWDISCVVLVFPNGATINTAANLNFGIGTASGNSSTGLVTGDSMGSIYLAGATIFGSGSIPCYRVSITGSTTYYLKVTVTYSVATPQAAGRISARRVR